MRRRVLMVKSKKAKKQKAKSNDIMLGGMDGWMDGWIDDGWSVSYNMGKDVFRFIH